jgi:hypothetical protein
MCQRCAKGGGYRQALGGAGEEGEGIVAQAAGG